MSTETSPAAGMIDICPVAAVSVERGAAALLPDCTQIGVFLLDDGSVRAIQQHDPYSGANILSRGLVGSHEIPGTGEEPTRIVATIASPMYKQVWDLDTGAVIDAGGGERHPIDVYPAEVVEGRVRVSSRALPRTEG